LSRQVLLLGEELKTFASPNKVLRVGHGGRLVEARHKGFSHKMRKGGMITVLTIMDLL
jgi:hypothetical protein